MPINATPLSHNLPPCTEQAVPVLDKERNARVGIRCSKTGLFRAGLLYRERLRSPAWFSLVADTDQVTYTVKVKVGRYLRRKSIPPSDKNVVECSDSSDREDAGSGGEPAGAGHRV